VGLAAVVQAMVDLVAHHPQAVLLGEPGHRAQILLAEDGSGGVGRRIHHDRPRPRPHRPSELVDPEPEALLGTHPDRHRRPAEERGVVAVGRVARIGDDHLVTGVEQRPEGEQHRGRRALGDHHVRRIHGHPVGPRVVLGHGVAQVEQPEGLRVTGVALLHRPFRRLGDRGRGGHVGIADLQAHHVTALGDEPLRLGDHVHHYEGTHLTRPHRHLVPRHLVPHGRPSTVASYVRFSASESTSARRRSGYAASSVHTTSCGGSRSKRSPSSSARIQRSVPGSTCSVEVCTFPGSRPNTNRRPATKS
jgi:hypothetical protein